MGEIKNRLIKQEFQPLEPRTGYQLLEDIINWCDQRLQEDNNASEEYDLVRLKQAASNVALHLLFKGEPS